ncbi:MAG: NMD3-related protein, partial [Candidatus Micrarchaeia archaeon]
ESMSCKKHFHLKINGKEIEKKTQVVLLLKKSSCSACLRKSSGYFEAIIQLRGNSLKVARARQDLQKAVKRFKSFINKTDEKKEGIDLFIESRQAAHEALGCLKLKYATSRKQSGMREGKKLYRTTYCVRL